jgi:hypothetical protein
LRYAAARNSRVTFDAGLEGWVITTSVGGGRHGLLLSGGDAVHGGDPVRGDDQRQETPRGTTARRREPTLRSDGGAHQKYAVVLRRTTPHVVAKSFGARAGAITSAEDRGPVHDVSFELNEPVLVNVEAQRHRPVVLLGLKAADGVPIGDIERVVGARLKPFVHAIGAHHVEALAY